MLTATASRPVRAQPRHDGHPDHAEVGGAGDPPAAVESPQRGARIVVQVSFTSAMTDADLQLLRRQLDMTTHTPHKLPADPNSPGVVRLDDDSGLFLERGAGRDQWLLQARTWGTPSARTIHAWQVRTAQVARQLDPHVTLPERAPETGSETPPDPATRPVHRSLTRERRPRRS